MTSAGLSKAIRLPLVTLVIVFVCVAAAFVVVQVAFEPLVLRGGFPGIAGRAGGTAASIIAGALLYAWLVRRIEQRPVSELSLDGAVAELARGALLGATLFGAVIATLWLLGSYHVVGAGAWSAAVGALVGSAGSATVEEILFRGVLFRKLEDQFGTWIALAVSAALFGLLHAANPHASLWSSAAIAIEAGILLGAAFVLTRRLWFVIGIHFAWNFTQGGVFGVAVSGGHASGLLVSTLTGPPLLSGGAFGAEASASAVVICLAAGLFCIWRARALGHVVPRAGLRSAGAA